MKNIAIVLLLLAMSCAAPTQITGSWKNPNKETKRYKKVMVAAMTNNLDARQSVERTIASALSERGITAFQSLEFIPPAFTDERNLDKEELLSKIRKTGADAILTVTLINRETESRYVPGNYGYAPMTRYGYYGRFSGYYTTLYPTLYSPGYYEENEVYFIETNLYDVETEELLWSAQSRTYRPSNLNKFSRDFTQLVLSRMTKDGVL